MSSIRLHGMVLSSSNVSDYDKRLVLLTKEKGRVTAFVKGARRPNNPLVAACSPFCYGTFEAFAGKNYHISGASIEYYFRGITEDFDKVCIGSYFLEMADYYSLEGMDESNRLKLLLATIKALDSNRFSLELIRNIYELKTWVIQGEYPNVFSCMSCDSKENLVSFSTRLRGCVCKKCVGKEGGLTISPSTLYTLQFIIATEIEKLYTFKLNEATQSELSQVIKSYRMSYFGHKFKSEEFLA